MRILKFLVIAEVLVFILVCLILGVLKTLGLTLIFSVVGFIILQRAGAGGMIKNARNKELMMVQMMSKGMPKIHLLIAGMLLTIPGFITDIIGLACLIPSVRNKIMAKVMQTQMNSFSPRQGYKRNQPIDADYIKHSSNDKNKS